eukprot:862262-Pelagomonas_calceolata.AAC.7
MVMGRGVPNAELPQLTPKDGTFASTPLVRNHTLSFSNARTAHGGHFKAEHKGMDDSGGLRKLVALEENVATGELKSPEADRGMEKTRPANGNVHGIPHASFTHGDESDSSSSSENEMGAADKALSMDGKGGVLTASKSGPSMISLLKPNKPDAGWGASTLFGFQRPETMGVSGLSTGARCFILGVATWHVSKQPRYALHTVPIFL